MTALEYKEEVMKLLDSGDVKLARMVYSFIKTYREEDPIVGSAAGESLRLSDLENQVLASEKDFEQGRFSSADELREEAKNW